jgi:hypothetical protein
MPPDTNYGGNPLRRTKYLAVLAGSYAKPDDERLKPVRPAPAQLRRQTGRDSSRSFFVKSISRRRTHSAESAAQLALGGLECQGQIARQRGVAIRKAQHIRLLTIHVPQATK